MVKNTRWAITENETANLFQKLMVNARDTRYKPRDTETDTAVHGHSKLAFHTAINMREFATNSPVTGKDATDC